MRDPSIHYKSFENVLKNAADWKYGSILISKIKEVKGVKDPLIVIDPVDPKRNVVFLSLKGSVSSYTTLGSFLESPSVEYFHKEKAICKRFPNQSLCHLFEGNMLDDIIYPQLRKSAIHVFSP